ncbi:MAG: hypothetical protein ACE5PM_02210 [Candidatus Hydrothermarchaeales archaeon]
MGEVSESENSSSVIFCLGKSKKFIENYVLIPLDEIGFIAVKHLLNVDGNETLWRRTKRRLSMRRLSLDMQKIGKKAFEIKGTLIDRFGRGDGTSGYRCPVCGSRLHREEVVSEESASDFYKCLSCNIGWAQKEGFSRLVISPSLTLLLRKKLDIKRYNEMLRIAG